jgi:hypothetical protein
MLVGKPKAVDSKLVEFFANAANQAEDSGVRIDQRRPNDSQPSHACATNSALLVHERRCRFQRLGNYNRLTLARIQLFLANQGPDSERVGNFGHGHPSAQRSLDGIPNRVARAAFNHLAVNRRRNYNGAKQLLLPGCSSCH